MILDRSKTSRSHLKTTLAAETPHTTIKKMIIPSILPSGVSNYHDSPSMNPILKMLTLLIQTDNYTSQTKISDSKKTLLKIKEKTNGLIGLKALKPQLTNKEAI